MSNVNSLAKRSFFRLLPLIATIMLAMLPSHTLCAKVHTIYVPPPNGVDDTANLQSALDACVAYGKKCTVQLAAGTYLTRQLVAYNFQGTFKGLGVDTTTIEAIYPLPVNIGDPFTQGECVPNTTTCLWPTLIMFVTGTATTGWPILGSTFTDLIDALRFMGKYPTNVTVDRIRVEGLPDNSSTSTGFNVINGVVFPGEFPRSSNPFDYYFLSGTLTVRNSSFKSMDDGVAAGAFLTSSKITIGGSPSTGNSFENVFVGLDMESAEKSHFEISYNVSSGITNSMWVVPWISPVFIPSSPSRYRIHDNRFSTTGPKTTGIYLYNEPSHPWIDAVVRNNSIELQEALSDGVDAFNTQSTTILNNTITGTGYDGIGLWSSTYSAVIGNNVSGYMPDPTVGLAQIHLDPATSFDLVVCLNPDDTLLNQGTNNIVIGCQQVATTTEAATGRVIPGASMPPPKRKPR